jgi:hypothetical protein
MRSFLLVMLLAIVVTTTGCTSTRGAAQNLGTPTTERRSQDATSALTGTWSPLEPQFFKRLEFKADGTLIQAVAAEGASLNTGTWSIESPGVLYCTLNTLGFGVPIARYRYVLRDSRLTLTWLGRDSRKLVGTEHWDPWIGGTDNLQIDLGR